VTDLSEPRVSLGEAAYRRSRRDVIACRLVPGSAWKINGPELLLLGIRSSPTNRSRPRGCLVGLDAATGAALPGTARPESEGHYTLAR
jgi:hypothetical protein